MLKYMIAACWLVSSVAGAAELSPEALRPQSYVPQEAMPKDQRVELAKLLEKHSSAYLTEVEKVSWSSFADDSQISAQVAASLVTEAEDVKKMMSEFVLMAKHVQAKPEDDQAWMLLARNFYIVLSYIEDLERFEIVRSTEHVGVRMLMPAVLDRILLPGIVRK